MLFLLFLFSVNLWQQKDKKKKYEPPIPTRVGKKKKKTKGPDAASKLPLGKKLWKQIIEKTSKRGVNRSITGVPTGALGKGKFSKQKHLDDHVRMTQKI